VDITEVSELLGLCNFLKAPKHVFITQEDVFSEEDGKITHYRGLQPKAKSDAIFLAAQSDDTTPIHETVHASLGLGEFGTEVLTRVIMRKNEAVSNMPLLKGQLSRKLVYQRVEQSKDYPEAHSEKYRGRVEHYVLAPYVESGDY
jgi:hypothetical protein